MGWSRKNSTRWSARACFSAPIWLSPRGSRRSTPAISAPMLGVSGVMLSSPCLIVLLPRRLRRRWSRRRVCIPCPVPIPSRSRATMPQAPLVAPDELAGMIPPTRTALLVIDVQRDFAAPDGAVARAGADMSRVEEALERIEALVGLARRAGATLAFARVLTQPETDSAALKLLNARKGGDADEIAI